MTIDDLRAKLRNLRERLAAHAEQHIDGERDAIELVGLADEVMSMADRLPPPPPQQEDSVPTGPLIFTWPTDFKVVTQQWGERPEYYKRFNMRAITRPAQDGHEGIDVRTGQRGRIYAIAAGVVYYVGERGNYGYHIRLEHSFGSAGPRLRSLYAHLERGSAKVKAGDRVKPGQVIGLSGKTGNIQGEHLHLSVYEMIDNVWYLVDPLKFLYGALQEK